jgi:hypothetical protein
MIVIEPNLLLQAISYTHKIVSGTADIKEGKKGREGVTQQQWGRVVEKVHMLIFSQTYIAERWIIVDNITPVSNTSIRKSNKIDVFV